MKRFLIAAAVALIGSALWIDQHRGPIEDADETPTVSNPRVSAPEPTPALEIPPEAAPVAPPDFSQSFAAASDAMAYMTALQESSNENPGALYYAGKMLKECEEAADAWFSTRTDTGHRDAATTIAQLGPAATECGAQRIQRTWDRCRSYYESDGASVHGAADEWIERAAQAGDPSAKAAHGIQLWKAAVQALTSRKSDEPVARDRAKESRALQLIVQAAHSRVPEALSQLALQAPFTGPMDMNRGALILATCQGDTDCQNNSELACHLSASDPSLDGSMSVTQILQTQHAGSDYDAMREKADRVIASWSNSQVDEMFVQPYRQLLELLAQRK